jgi:hypothetical protein
MYTSQHSGLKLKPGGSSLGRTLTMVALVAALLAVWSLTAGAQSGVSAQLTITISTQGMTPSSATVSAGIVHLKIQNQSNNDQLTLRVSRESGELVREVTVTAKGGEWATELELSAGQYVITEASNTSWTCHITAQAPASNSGGAPGAAVHP